MTPQDYIWMFDKSLGQLATELEAYPSEEALWQTGGAISNSAGHLAQHLAGNLQHFVGRHIGGTDYRRDRDSEFSQRKYNREQLLELIARTRSGIRDALQHKDAAFLEEAYSTDIMKIKDGQTTGFMLSYLYAHLNYHLGQVNYHRRLLAASK